VPVIAYLVSPLLKSSVRVLAQPVTILDPVKESECSVMEPDDVGLLLLLNLNDLQPTGSLHNIIRFTLHQSRYIC
jgi:hypothetical protein